jgi:hypothetical protein
MNFKTILINIFVNNKLTIKKYISNNTNIHIHNLHLLGH